jgi:hypothetical protein
MKHNWNAIKIITLVLLGLLILIGGVLTLMGGTRALGLGMAPGQPGQFTGSLPEGMAPPEGGQFTPGDGVGAPPSGFDTGQAGGNMNRPLGFTNGGRDSTQMKLLRLGQYALGGSVVLFGLLTLVGVWLDRKWGKVMTITTGAIVLTAAIVSLFPMRFNPTIIEALVKIVLAVGVIVLAFLPGKKSQAEGLPQ